MENWQGVFLLIIGGALVNLIVAFGVLRGLAGLFGVSSEVNSARRALISLVTIVPVAGVAGAPFFIVPFIGPIAGVCISGFVAALMFADKYEVPQRKAAGIILPTVAVIFLLSGAILYYALPRL